MKTTQVLKAVIIGAVAGAAIFFVPVPFPFFFTFFFIFIAFRFFGLRRRRGSYNDNYGGGFGMWSSPDNAHKWHSMTPQQRQAFTEKMEEELAAQNSTSTQTI